LFCRAVNLKTNCMRGKNRSLLCSSILCLSVFLYSGCMKDKITRTYTISTPIYQVLTKFRELIKSLPAAAIHSTGKITLSGHYIFLSESNKGIHIIDNSNPSAPKNVSFINIPGNEDLAIKGNMLYADAYGDLITFDITDPLNVKAIDFETNVFTDHSIYYFEVYPASGTVYNPDSINVIVGYNTRDTTVDYDPDSNPIYFGPCINCSVYPASSMVNYASNTGTGTGINGSMARFSIINNFLYTVGSSDLVSFDISQPSKPVMSGSVMVDYHVETIYPLNDRLFVGTNNGMYMYDVLSSPSSPSLLGKFTHLRGCDPVIADNNYAYVTLNDSSACLGYDDQLQIVDIHDMSNSFLVKSYQLTHPMGLSKDGSILFICDGRDGLKIYNAADVNNLTLVRQLKDAYTTDVIARNGLAIVMDASGILEYDYTDTNNIHQISKL
jgi:hypothetical protein